MVVRSKKEVPNEEGKNVELIEQKLEGYNQFAVGEDLPIVGKWLGKHLSNQAVP